MSPVELYIVERPSPQRELMELSRSLILELGPKCREQISYNIPFFQYYGRLCYLSPKGAGMYIGFVRGNELSNEQNLLEVNHRQFVRSITMNDIQRWRLIRNDLRDIIQEAALLNEMKYDQKN